MRQIFSQPPGTGKTRTILSFIYLRCLRDKEAKIVVRFEQGPLQTGRGHISETQADTANHMLATVRVRLQVWLR